MVEIDKESEDYDSDNNDFLYYDLSLDVIDQKINQIYSSSKPIIYNPSSSIPRKYLLNNYLNLIHNKISSNVR